MSFFNPLPMFGFDAILIDVPWRYEMRSEKGEARSPQAKYPTLSDEEALALPVGDLASSTCALVMWAVWPKMPLAQACMAKWGFKHITGGSWIKTTKDGMKPKMGTGYVLRSACEPFLIGRIGPALARLTDVPNVIVAPARQHSRKPDEMRAIVERLTPGGRRVDLFARAPWKGAGNSVWGNETRMFPA